MSDMWVTASADHQGEIDDRAFHDTRAVTASVWPFLAAASDVEEFETRLALCAPKIDVACDAVADRPIDRTALRLRVDASLREDFEVFAAHRESTAAGTPCPKCGSVATSWSKFPIYDGKTNKCSKCGNTWNGKSSSRHTAEEIDAGSYAPPEGANAIEGDVAPFGAEAARTLRPGDRARISDGSGIDSGKTVTIAHPHEFSGGQGHYKPVNWSEEHAVRHEDGRVDTMFKNRLTKIESQQPTTAKLAGEMPPQFRENAEKKSDDAKSKDDDKDDDKDDSKSKDDSKDDDSKSDDDDSDDDSDDDDDDKPPWLKGDDTKTSGLHTAALPTVKGDRCSSCGSTNLCTWRNDHVHICEDCGQNHRIRKDDPFFYGNGHGTKPPWLKGDDKTGKVKPSGLGDEVRDAERWAPGGDDPRKNSEHDEDDRDYGPFVTQDGKRKKSVRHTAPGGGEHGGYHIEEDGGRYKVVNHIGEVKSTFDSHDKALAYQRALMVNVPGAQESAERHEDHGDKAKHSSLHVASAFDQARDALASMRTDAEYHYIRERDGKYEVFQKGTGKTLSTHDSREEAEASFRAMMRSKHGSSLQRAAAMVSEPPPFAVTAAEAGWKIEDINDILDKHQHRKIQGVDIDAQTASAIKTVHDTLKPENQERYRKMHVTRAADFAWKHVTPGEFHSSSLDAKSAAQSLPPELNNVAPALRSIFEMGDWYDAWATTMGFLFSIADLMTEWGPPYPPAQWEFRQGVGGSDTEAYEYQEINAAREGQEITSEDLLDAGNALNAVADRLEAEGRSY